MLIILRCKGFYGTSFPYLTSTFYNKWLSFRVIFPCFQISIYLSSKEFFHILIAFYDNANIPFSRNLACFLVLFSHKTAIFSVVFHIIPHKIRGKFHIIRIISGSFFTFYPFLYFSFCCIKRYQRIRNADFISIFFLKKTLDY